MSARENLRRFREMQELVRQYPPKPSEPLPPPEPWTWRDILTEQWQRKFGRHSKPGFPTVHGEGG